MSLVNHIINNAALGLTKEALKGDKGDTGSQGIPGQTGSQGIQGETGVKGDQGIQGVPGLNTITTSTETDITGILKGASSLVAQAVAGTDFVAIDDSRLSDARTPTAHSHTATDVTGTAVLTADARLSDERVPTSHDNTKHSATYITATGVTYANLNANGSVGVGATQVAFGNHTHDTILILAGDITNASLTVPSNLTGMVFSYDANSKYIIDMYIIQRSAAATTGCGFAMDTSSVVTNVQLGFFHQLANTGTLSGGSSIADAAITGVSSGLPTAATNVMITGSGILITGAKTGTAQFTLRAEAAANTTTKAGSIIIVRKVA